MTPEQFNKLTEGDLIRNKTGHGFFVVRNNGHGASLVVQCILDVPRSLCELWTHTAELLPVRQVPPPQEAKPKHLPRIIMHRQVLDAQGVAVESKEGTTYRIRGRVFDTLEAAWDALPKVKFEGGKTLFQRRLDLRKVGWTMDDSSGGVVWTSPHSGRRIPGTRAAWDYVFGDDAP